MKTSERAQRVLTPDQRLRVFISSAMQELAPERSAARAAIEGVQLTPVLFELGARPHPPRTLYQAYLQQSQIFVGLYWQAYGWVAPDMDVSGVEDEFRDSAGMPRLLYIKEPAPQREPRLQELLRRFQSEASFSYKKFATADDLRELIPRDLVLLISERFDTRDDALVGPTFSVPAPRTSFIGRAAELERLQELLSREDVRLVTVTGPGGIGKTRLAIEGARRFADHYPDGVIFVPLEGIGDASLVVPAIATAIGIRELGTDPAAAIAAYLRSRSMLLVLDNFEHVIAGAPVVSSLLEEAPGLRIIVTSRELLRLRGEHELPVPPLAAQEDAIALFKERAAAARNSFEIAAEDLPVIEEICRRLDGVPLAIELAAPRMRLLSPKQLLQRLSEHLALGGLRDAPARHQTLDTAVDWSYQLLSAEERQLFDQLGVFRGSFTIKSVESVCELPPESDLLDLVAALLDKSMIYRLADGNGPRFAMLGMIREYALDRLARAGQLDAVFARLTALYLRFAPDAERGLRSAAQRRWKSLVDAEADNIRVILGRLGESSVPDLLILLRSLWMWFWLSGRFDEWRSWSRRALEGAEGAVADRAWVIGIDAGIAFAQADFAAAAVELEQARELFREAGDAHAPVLLDVVAAVLTAVDQGYEPAIAQIATSSREFEELEDAWGAAMCLNVIGWLRVTFDRFDDTGDVFERAVGAAEAVGDELQIVMALGNLAEAKLAAGQIVQAREAVQRALLLLHTNVSTYTKGELLEILARCSMAEADYAAAAELVASAEAVRESIHVPLWGPPRQRNERLLTQLRAALGNEAFEAARARGRARAAHRAPASRHQHEQE